MTAFTLFSQASLGIGSNTTTARITVGTEFEVTQSVTLTGIWWFSARRARRAFRQRAWSTTSWPPRRLPGR